eukprot:NODE_734_length_4708_cov_0.239531.p2 type:complete len:147 gc:universal NODE_734_length_4708_cov_0.239531:2368-1928(-)
MTGILLLLFNTIGDLVIVELLQLSSLSLDSFSATLLFWMPSFIWSIRGLDSGCVEGLVEVDTVSLLCKLDGFATVAEELFNFSRLALRIASNKLDLSGFGPGGGDLMLAGGIECALLKLISGGGGGGLRVLLGTGLGGCIIDRSGV